MTTKRSGNTRPSLMARHYQLTINDISTYEDVSRYLLDSKMINYYIACKEIAPTTGHEHIHIYCQFTSPKRLSIKKLLGAHVEICRGSPQENYDYIVKDGNVIFEWGELRKTGAKTIRDIKEMSRQEREDLDIRYYNIVEKINEKEDYEKDIDEWNKEVKVIYITGDSGSGKSQLAKRIIKSHIKNEHLGTNDKFNLVKHVNGFWCGVGDAKCCLYDEFRASHMCASEFIDFIDYNKHLLNVKGGHRVNNYETIIITSSIHPKDLYSNMPEEQKQQWLRRMFIIDLSKDKRQTIINDDVSMLY